MADLLLQDLDVVRDGRPVLSRCTATFAGGRRTVLWGRSGAGKSTLLAAIAGLVAPEAGTIRLGADVLFSRSDGIDRAPHTRGVGFVFQDLALWPHLTALGQVALVGGTASLDGPAALALLDSVGLSRSLAHRRPGQLSGGEQQRLAIARALAGQPALLLLDEPFSSLDRPTRRVLHALLRDVSPRIPGPTIYVTHSSEDARALMEDVLALEEGRLIVSERPWEREDPRE